MVRFVVVVIFELRTELMCSLAGVWRYTPLVKVRADRV